jgi:hypothetical protein
MKILGSALLALFFLFSAQAQPDRLTTRIDESARAVPRGHVSPQIGPQNDAGPVEPSFRLQGMTINFKPSPSQQQALDRLLEEQQNPASPQFHKWLTPEEYADRFGLSRADIAKVSAWLRSHGFKIGHAARGRQWILFSGTAEQVRKAFQVEIRHYRVQNKLHYANSADPSIPAAFRDIVLGIQGLDDFVPQPGGHETDQLHLSPSRSKSHISAVEARSGDALALAARPEREVHVGFVFARLHVQPGQRSVAAGPLAGLRHQLAEAFAILVAEVKHHDGMEDHGGDAGLRDGELRHQPFDGIGAVQSGRDAAGHLDGV